MKTNIFLHYCLLKMKALQLPEYQLILNFGIYCSSTIKSSRPLFSLKGKFSNEKVKIISLKSVTLS